MTLARLLPGALFALLLLPLAPTSAQQPKVGRDWYEDAVEHGFKIKYPKDWNQIPPSPNERTKLAEFSHPTNDWISIGKGEILPIFAYLLVFDDRRDHDEEKDGAYEPPRELSDPPKEVLDWVERRLAIGVGWIPDGKPKKLKVKGLPAARTYELEATHNSDEEVLIRMFVAEFLLPSGVRIAFLADGPGDRKWSKYKSAYGKLAKSFTVLEMPEEDVVEASGPRSPRDAKREVLEKAVAKNREWSLHETPNYFLVTDVDDKEFIEDILERIEAIRKIYEEHYPPEQARAIKKKKESLETEVGKGATDEDNAKRAKEEEEEKNRSISAVNPMEASRTSVLRLCSERDIYMKYGGPGGSAGYWYWVEEELVLYDDKKVRGRDFTLLVMNHEAFHQYIFYFYGQLAPHSWYNEGTGDFYSGYQYKQGRYRLGKPNERNELIREMLRDGNYVPLEEFVTWSKGQYYGSNDLGMSGLKCYAQGWSLIYFLRTGPDEKPSGWQPAWGSILDTYLETLATTGDLEKAVETAFAGVDWAAFEECWKNYIG